MADDPRPPVAIRSMRPYATEEAFLAEERDTLSRTAVTLIGGPSRPRGVVIRFEITLNDGTAIVRGEGRVLGFQAADERGPSSLTLRFTRLDAKSKALVDRAAELREAAAQRGSIVPPSIDVPGTDPPPANLDEPGDALESTTAGAALSFTGDAAPSSDELMALSLSSASLPYGEVDDIGGPTLNTTAPTTPDASKRNALLDRLRTRAKELSPTQVATILASPRPTA